MKKPLLTDLTERQTFAIEITLIFLFAIVPLFATYPYRINIFLSWEGAYRMYLGQVPYKDFGLPVGYGYWIMPFIFFKIFGPYLATLVKAQIFINIISGLAFRSILKSLNVPYGIRLLGVFLFVVSYSFFNFWPWYNHTVIVFEIIGLALLIISFKQDRTLYTILFTIGASFFLFLSFFTKQDGGFFALLLGGTLVTYQAVYSKSFKPLLYFSACMIAVILVMIGPLIPYDFLYWFNYGQPPHYSRFNLFDIINEFLDKSIFIKFYLLIILGIFLSRLKDARSFFLNRDEFILFLITLGILIQATVLQVTSYTPPDGNIYFHSFCFVFILANIKLDINYASLRILLPFLLFIFLWWSGTYWKYVSRTVARIFPQEQAENSTDKISISTYKLERDTTELNKATWKLSGLKAFDRVYMPVETIDGIKRLQSLEMFNKGNKPKVLNMTELTPLAYELGYELETKQPLWYHLNVALFDRELNKFIDRINADYYDLVLFEIIPNLNNFNPNAIRDVLMKRYDKVDTFQAPRRKTTEVIEVYVKRKTTP